MAADERSATTATGMRKRPGRRRGRGSARRSRTRVCASSRSNRSSSTTTSPGCAIRRAELVDDAGRKGALLDNAVDGFSKFVEMKEVPEVYAESLYGRGLAYMELRRLGERARGPAAPRRAAQRPPRRRRRRSPRWIAARAASRRRRRAGDPEPLLDKLAAGLPKAAADPAAEKDVTALARGLAARGGEWPAKVQGAGHEEARRRHAAGVALELRPVPAGPARHRPRPLRATWRRWSRRAPA